ncbi:hypothetical protein [Flavivirga algicola]|uniref:Uncharacterized protein n=1 Tax=Flavivirga algicola TaxID=2729136 RepID=A0ABX1RWP6_9FLAO|nr:hypothetical protein [Flavivirga algicola]NMH87991.1 hypothetical protein [Flavivirga algicola]
MRTLYLSITLIILCFSSIYSQSKTQSVFVMVDLSKNVQKDNSPITLSQRQDAIAFTKSIITASYASNKFPNWKKTGVFTSPEIEAIIKGKGKPLIGVDDFLMVMPFGEISSTNKFQINLVGNYPSDFNKYYKFPFSYNDNDTWGDYAEAKVCNIAYNNQILEYYIIRIQGMADDPNSRLLDKEDLSMVDEYETGSVGEVVARFKHTTASRFTVTVKKIDISKIDIFKNGKKVTITPTNTDKKSLRIISPKGTRKTPFTMASSNIRVSWTCIGCDSLPKYTLRAHNLKTKKTKNYSVKNKTFQSLKLEPATYKINVSTKGANSKAQYITVKGESGDSGGFGVILLLLLLGVGGYFAYKYLIAGRKENTNKERSDWAEREEKSPPSNTDTTSQDEDW